MQIGFRLEWLTKSPIPKKVFKHPGAQLLFFDYVERIERFTKVSVTNATSETRISGSRLWICSTEKHAVMLTSSDLANRLSQMQDQSVKHLNIAIGGPDGFSQEMTRLNCDFKWSFGPQTLPHELAAVVAAEQIYRAYTIMNHQPYHEGH